MYASQELPLGYLMLENEAPYNEQLARRFMLSQTEVTQELWESVMGNNPSRFKEAKRPVENISWEDCQRFLVRLNEMRDELGVPLDYIFTLPKESEWEHACRSGTTTPFHFGHMLNGSMANCNGNFPYGTFETGKKLGQTTEVGRYPANPWGLQDMHGNVWEWCEDACDYALAEKLNEPLVRQLRAVRGLDVEEIFRIRRGGSWHVFAQYCRSAYRSCGNPAERHDDARLRLCLAATAK